MLDAPKGLEYWYQDSNGVEHIKDDAPGWAKKEFIEYQEQFDSLGKPRPDGIVIQ